MSARSRRTVLLAAAGVTILAGLGLLAALRYRDKPRGPDEEAPVWVRVKRVRSGDTLIVDPDNKLMYAGIRAPVEGEPLYEQASQRNTELVDGKQLRLRFDAEQRDKKERLAAYVFLDQKLINAELVREGLAFVRLTPQTQRFAQALQAAQAEARLAKRGLWKLALPAPEAEYWGDSKYGNFHRPKCVEREKVKPERIVNFTKRGDAFDRGFAPCTSCKP